MTVQSDAPEDRFCDLVLKGGITSGVVYPPAISALAKQYRFKSIGGTSAGAIAAAVTAAAEYRRRQGDGLAGFNLLEALPHDLSIKDGTGNTRLLRLFQPQPGTRRLFGILLAALNRTSMPNRLLAVVWSCLRLYWAMGLLGLSIAAVAGTLSGSWYVGLTVLIAAVIGLVGASLYFDVTRGLVANNYGMCTGMTADPSQGEALTPWLHELIQTAAGRTAEQDPLTFGDLWSAPGFPPKWIDLPASVRARSIDLQMFTTNLTHGRPYVFPHTDNRARLFFQRSELAKYLPPIVLRWINEHALEYAPSGDSDPPAEAARELGLRELPDPSRLPILLAARMSLSFPLLFATVPLWAIDYSKPRGQRVFERCVFSDGGICSNFPMHLFDGLVTAWPTFGIQLEEVLEGRNRVYLPKRYGEGYGDRWNHFDRAATSATRLGGFVSSIITTMQNWNDTTLTRMPGVRDRVVRLRLSEEEGGINLNMPAPLIATIATYGRMAAQELIDHYGKANVKPTRGWDEQRWVRLDVLINGLKQRLIGLGIALDERLPHATSYEELIDRSADEAPPGHDAPLSPAQIAALRALKHALQKMAEEFRAHSETYSQVPIPEPELRIRPPL